MKFSLLVALFISLQISLFANSQAYSLATYYTFNLKFDKAKEQIAVCKKSSNYQIQAYYLENYIDFLTVLLAQSNEKFEVYSKNSEVLYEKIEDASDDNPFKLYALAHIKFQNTVSNFLFGNNLTAGWEIFRANKLLNENKKKFPDFFENNKLSSVFDIFFSAIPSEYKWVADGLGLNANLNRGFTNLKKYYTHYKADTLTQTEPTLIYALMLMQFGEDKMTAHTFLKNTKLIKINSLARYLYGRISAVNNKNDDILSVLKGYKQPSDEFQIPFFDFLLAKAKLNKLDLTAETEYSNFLKKYKGQNYLKLVYQRLSWISLFQNNTTKYTQYLTKTKSQGKQIVAEDKQAYAEVTKRKMPNKQILAARLYFDGAYYEKALAELAKCNLSSLSDYEKLEYNYRHGQIYFYQKNRALAIKFYTETIKLGSGKEYYYAPYSAVNLGVIYKQQGDIKNAEYYFKKALEINKGEMKDIIEVKAKNGLKSLKTK